ncbi:MAG: hypothetical protein IJZ90_03475, partial [Clostridia bacterium]|nr:hypothetical protein [Clostridia bacterium]
MILIFAYTPYQLVNSLNLVKSMGEECVVALRFFWKDSQVLAKNFSDDVCKDEFVKGVYYLKHSSFESPSLFKRILYKILYGKKSTIKHYFPQMGLNYEFDGVILSKLETCAGVLSSMYTD